jgi:hypothetical protein
MVVEERKKREWERPTDRRMRPGEVFNWEESWDFVSLGAVLPSTDGRRNTVPPAHLFAFQGYLSSSCSPHLPHFVKFDVLRAAKEPEGNQNTQNTKKRSLWIEVGRILTPVFPVSRVNPGGRARSRVLDRPAAFHKDPYRKS